jgi:ERI1 exoribonuclease 2
MQVDRGVPLSEALLMHDKWLEDKGIKNKNFAIVTWSNWDCRIMLESECRFKRIRKPPYFNRLHILYLFDLTSNSVHFDRFASVIHL